jgi:hypothetical protein
MSDQSFDKKHEECLHGIPKGFSCRDCEFMADSLYPQSSTGESSGDDQVDDMRHALDLDCLADREKKLDAIAEALDMPKDSWRIAGCDVLAHQVRDLMRNYLALRDATQSANAAPTRASEAMADAVRGFLQLIRANPGTTFKEVRRHCELRGDDLSKWPEWVLSAEGYVTERVGAMALYEIMAIAASDGNINK